jgi:mono/diheme cytochrome c family protein
MSHKNLVTLILMALFLISPRSYAKDARADLTIVQGASKHVLTQLDFRQLQVDSVIVNDPVYKKHKRYAGYWLSDIFAYEGIHADRDTVWTFTALDGYKASIAVADIQKYGVKAFVAIEDLDRQEGWEKIQQGKEWVSPGPYYVVWQTPLEDATPQVKLPWPYQVVEISIHKADDGLQKLITDSTGQSASVKQGYKIFQQNCTSCHSLNLEGGVLGPELNVPRNILEYEDRKFLKAFIGSPSSFRARSKMPSFNKTLSTEEIDAVLDYLNWMGQHKKGEDL